jgi:hypothetical protein
VRMAIWSKTDDVLLSRDRVVNAGNVTQTLKPKTAGPSKAVKVVRATIWGEMDGLLLGRDCFVNIGNVT